MQEVLLPLARAINLSRPRPFDTRSTHTHTPYTNMLVGQVINNRALLPWVGEFVVERSLAEME
jgi:hypothetical protein